MKCSQCERRAIYQVDADEAGTLLLCLDCNLKYEAGLTMQLARLATAHNHAAESLENTLGIPVARFAVPRVPIAMGALTTNNIHIRGDLLGVLNTGSIQTVDNSVTAIRNSGDEALAKRLAEFVEEVARSRELSDAERREVVELVSFAASEATVPRPERRSVAMLRVLADISTIVGNAVTIATQWEPLKTLLAHALSA